mmetsp:Transcript_32991/g.84074  ORF Transcript_32991/g.84074 Transcript_32991/m.84074 type:complete len:233 (-) Transcript_32991:109-807(-)
MRLPALPANAQAAVAAALMCCSLTIAPPAFGVDNIYGAAGEFTPATQLEGGYRGSVPGQDKQIAAGKGAGAEKAENSKIQGGGASTLQGGRRITITRGVNLDNTNWKGEDLRGVAFQQSVVRSANFQGADIRTASFFDADLSNSDMSNANAAQVNFEMADLTNVDLTNADLTEAYVTGAVLNGPKGALTKIDNTDWTDAQLRKDQRTYLCTIAKGENPKTGVETRMSLMCKD